MAHNSSQWVNHVIDGGWATDYGSTFYSTPQDGEIRIPWCKTCENIRFNQDGSFGKYPGLHSLLTTPIKPPRSSGGYIEDSTVQNIFSYTRLGTSFTGTTVNVAIVGSWLYDITSPLPIKIGDVISSATSGVGPGHHITTFNDLLIVGGPFTPYSWDQTTFQALAGTPPAFGFSTAHAGRHWAAGVSANPSRLYYSVLGNPEDWAGVGSGSIDIDPGDGDHITALLSWKRELWVFKGPNKLSIHRITGTSSSDFARLPFVYGISAAGPHSLFQIGDDFSFWSPRGSCHSLTATSNYGDYTQSYINFPILSWCRNPSNIINGQGSKGWQTITDYSQNISYSLLNNTFESGYNSKVIMMDWRFKTESNPYPRFSTLNLGRKFTAMGLLKGVFDSSQLLATFGTLSGQILQEAPSNIDRFYNDDTAFPYRIETPAMTYGPPVYKKTITGVSIDITKNFSTFNGEIGTLEFSYGGRGLPAQTLTLSSRGGVLLGTFVLGDDQLGGGNDIHEFSDNVTGESTEFSYTLRETSGLTAGVGNDVQIKQFGVLITPSGESLENN